MNGLCQHIAVKREASSWEMQKRSDTRTRQKETPPTPAVIARSCLLCSVHSWHPRAQKAKGRMTDRNVKSEKALKEPTQLDLEKKEGLDKMLALKEVKIASRKKCSSGKGRQGKAG